MTDAMDRTRAAIAGLPDDEDELYRVLAMRLKAIERDPAKAGEADPRLEPQELGIAFVDLVDFGKRAFERLAVAGHSFVCGTESDEGYRLERLLATAGKDVTAITATVATLLVGQLAVAPAVAGVVATIVVGKVAPGSLEALCRTWGSRLPATTETATSGATAGGASGDGAPVPQEPVPPPPPPPPAEEG